MGLTREIQKQICKNVPIIKYALRVSICKGKGYGLCNQQPELYPNSTPYYLCV